MPYINIRSAGALSHEQKSEIAQEITSLMERVADKSPAATYIVFDDVPRENWAKSGQLLSEPPTA
ncbi:MAG: 4-oxalocrotonate tautomerase [Actinobacteria bacterium]|nr:4-oxalocrotonate tautomerase [Actinomycetota bacterium]